MHLTAYFLVFSAMWLTLCSAENFQPQAFTNEDYKSMGEPNFADSCQGECEDNFKSEDRNGIPIIKSIDPNFLFKRSNPHNLYPQGTVSFGYVSCQGGCEDNFISADRNRIAIIKSIDPSFLLKRSEPHNPYPQESVRNRHKDH